MILIFIRHGEYDLPDDKKRYVGITDYALSDEGRKSVMRAAASLKSHLHEIISEPRVYSSPLLRCTETAEIIKRKVGGQYVHVHDQLHEIDLGTWEGEKVEDIMRKYPGEYEERGRNLADYKTPGGESFEEAGERFAEAVRQIERVETIDGNGAAVIVAHRGVILSGLGKRMNISVDDMLKTNLDYCGMILFDSTRNSIKLIQNRLPDSVIIDKLYSKYHVPENVKAHMRKVADVADLIADNVNSVEISEEEKKRIHAAAMLHDICRLKENHAAAGAEALRREGYAMLADLVELHHSSQPVNEISAESILYYSDKIVQEDSIVSVEERFKKSLKKCETEEALKRHKEQYEKTKKIEQFLMDDMNLTIEKLLEVRHEVDENRRCSGTGVMS